MRIDAVRLIAFGPFEDRTVAFAPGMTVIFGPNEAGKTTLHAATYAGLCGVRRGRGGPLLTDRAFSDNHRPWDGKRWEVAATITLADGRRIELRHDLDGRVNCRAIDIDLGRDVSNEIIVDGAPDGSRWLGLDRRAFLATACVKQADILAVLQSAEALQDHLQRAAATAGTDETAARALTMLEAFQSEKVGLDRANSTRPLRCAVTRVQAAEKALDEARRRHATYLRKLAEADALGATAEESRVAAAALEAVVEDAATRDLEAKLGRAQTLSDSWASVAEPDLAHDEALSQRVSGALAAWSGRPPVPDLAGDPADVLRAKLASLPPTPVGDPSPAQAVLDARADLEGTRRSLAAHLTTRPEQMPPSATAATTPDELRDLARELELPPPWIDPALRARRDELRGHLDKPQRRPVRVPALLAAAVLLAAVTSLAITGMLLPAALASACMLVALAAAVMPRGDTTRLRSLEELRDLESHLGGISAIADSIQTRRHAAATRCAALLVPPDPARLRQLADEAAASVERARSARTWEATWTRFSREVAAGEERLRAALGSRGAAAEGDLDKAVGAYLEACQRRQAVHHRLAGRAELEAQLRARQELEAAGARAREDRDAAEQQLRQVAAECGVAGPDDETLAAGLTAWLADRAARTEEHQRHVADGAELRTILGDGTIEALRQAATERRRSADRLLAAASPAALAAVRSHGAAAEQMRRLRDAADADSRTAQRARGAVQETASTLPNVALAEEELEAARQERSRVTALRETLTITRDFLEKAQASVHRDIAPLLATVLRGWLPRVTGDRYTDVAVDPETLVVSVCGAARSWRAAQLLSHGTREQIYLLLRVAMVDRLTAPGEQCPLLLDEPTVQSDHARTTSLLDLLHEISRERQVILFSQEEDVLEWSEAHLCGPADRIERLDTAVGVA